ncbi:hypothetical protein [Microbacterium sp. Leaf320]|uniref:hypothetical protein n=1 Tax=Microbacterium sp. Leaf320 TaxID=1736334 RepID=UPI0006FA4E19|nr:hypothetical protein [Microbacterium sp. Leaf320]KQQ66936.1 hypothetical protein ASF63_06720 [Microbacterium sp. Leaf320]
MTTESDAIVWNSELPHELYAAMGRVAHSTALLDAMLGEFAEYLTDSTNTWVFVSGQSTDWLIQTCRVLLETTLDPQRTRYPDEFHKALRQQLSRASDLRNLRNRVIHGTWSNASYAEDPLHRPWGDTTSERTFWVARDRQRRSFEEQAMTASDVNRLADEIDLVTDGVIRAWRSVTPHRPDWPPFRRWHDLGLNSSED